MGIELATSRRSSHGGWTGRLAGALGAALVAFPMLATVMAPAAANAEENGVGLTPALGWSSWSAVRHNPTAAMIGAQADALVHSGLARLGFRYVNIDDFWYQCPGSQGPNVDAHGRWVTDSTKFPGVGRKDGMALVAERVHADGLKFGLYVTPGISAQAVARNTVIEGTRYHAADIAETNVAEKNYNCQGMVGIDYTKPGAQEFIDSWARQFASWGVDYLKIDGVGSFDIPDVRAWSIALLKTGRPIHVELSNNLDPAKAATWARYANGWRTGDDIECYCSATHDSYPLTSWDKVRSRFDQVASWQPAGAPGGFNDYDSIEVGNGANDGLTLDERKTQLSLWSLASSPLILGTDLTELDPGNLTLLKNTDVLAVDQDAIDASRVANSATAQVFAKTEPNGDVVAGLYNLANTPAAITATTTELGLPPGSYRLNDLWTHQATTTTGAVNPVVPAHGVALYRITRAPIPALSARGPATEHHHATVRDRAIANSRPTTKPAPGSPGPNPVTPMPSASTVPPRQPVTSANQPSGVSDEGALWTRIQIVETDPLWQGLQRLLFDR